MCTINHHDDLCSTNSFQKRKKFKKERHKENDSHRFSKEDTTQEQKVKAKDFMLFTNIGCDFTKSRVTKHYLYVWLCILVVLNELEAVSGYANHPPRFLIDGQTEIVLRLKEGKETPVGSLIYKLRGYDPDGDPLTFGVRELIGNEILRIEKVGNSEANVYLKKELDRESKDEYGLVLTLTDGRLGDGNFITQSLLILVEDVNDNEPVFKPYQSTITIPENSSPGILTTVEATDQDEGTYGQVVYHLQELDGDDDIFSISTVNGKGVIRLVGELDYEKKYLYQLRVLAVDRSNNERVNTGTAAILVKVEDVEDQLPEFLIVSPVTRISEDAPIGSPVLKVKAVDGDRGINNRISYSITKGAQGVFEIDPVLGIVFTIQKLDRESPFNSNGAYILEITAQEESRVVSPPPASRTEVTVIVTDVNDEIPTFRSESYAAEVNENAQANTPVTFLGDAKPEVFDHDQGNNGTFQMFIDGDRGVFEVTPSTGINEASFLIRVKDPSKLDYEKVSFLNFTLIAKETVPNNPKYSLVSVTVYIKDMNDNVPQFVHNVYEVNVPENSKAGTTVAWVQAVDEDSGDYGTDGIRYTALGGSIAELLSLDPVTGVITISSDGPVFDRELVDRHYLTVEVGDDLGKGNRNTVQLIIDVDDVNDNSPNFLQSRYEARLLENQLHFETPLILEAHDKDLNGTKNSEIHYSIVEGDRFRNFTIDPINGLLQPITHVDFEELAAEQGKSKGTMAVRPITLLVRAQDLGTPSLSSDVLVTVHVLDMNDHAPIFDQAKYERSVPEDLSPGSSVLQVKAYDGDASSPNNDVIYRIQKGAKDKFVIDAITGVISVAPGASLDPDLTDPQTTLYTLTVLAVDGGIGVDQLQATVDVNITVTDVNNKPPVFKEPGTIRIRENVNVGEYVYRVVATDQDQLPILRYRIDGNNSEARNEEGTILKPSETDYLELFDLNALDGMLRVKKLIDREKVETIRLALTCEDLAAAREEQISTAVLTIIVEDENDNNPQFRKPFYRRSITENGKNGLTIVNIVADDPDKNRTIKYSLEGPKSVAGLVHLDADTGEMVVANKIDHELTPWLNLTVRATDSGVPARSSLVEVFVQILDENDNNPYFVGELANLTVREDASIGTEIAKIEAHDADSGDFGKVTFLLDRMSSQGKFHINPDTGVLLVSDYLDREVQSSYLLVIEAWDNYQFGYSSGESRNAFKQIGVTVVDVNDEPPVFEPIQGCVTITEFHDTRDAVTIVKAHDGDDPFTPNGRITFRIASGNANNLFRIENVDFGSARISAAVPLKGFYGNYTLVVEAQDMGTPPNIVDQEVPICVMDFNDNPPRFISPPHNVTIKVPENTTVGNAIIQVVADDDDTGPNGAVRYRLKRDPVGSWRTFGIDERTGVITLKQPLDRERQKIYELRVEAHDLGVPTSLSSDLDLTIYVKNVNDFEPQFLVDEFHVNFTEHEAPGLERRILVETVDKDDVDDVDDPPSQVCYFIVAGNEQGMFSLEPLRHELVVEQELDREEIDTHVLMVKATEDCLHAPANESFFDKDDDTFLKVIVKVNDINDHPPKFVKRVFTGGVTTSADFGTEFMRVKAIDRDEGKNGEVKYYQIGRTQMTLTEGMETITNQPFLVDEETGSFYLNFYPQKGMKGYFDLMVLANDTDGLQDMARVYIYLLREDQRVRFVLRQHPTEVRDRIDKFRDGLKDVTGAVVNVDEFKVHENKDGSVDNTKTDLYLHFVNQKDNSIIDVHQVLQMVDQNIERLDGLFKDFNVLDTQPAEALRLDGERQNAQMMWLLGVIVFLAIMLVLVLSLCMSQRTRYKRAIKAATATAFGSEQSDLNRITGRVPNTNMHSVEGSNPMWMKAYENEWYKEEEDSMSQASERDSLDNNAVVSEQQKTINSSERHSDNSNSTYNSTSNILPSPDKSNSVKEQNDLNRSNYHQNLYQSMSQMTSPLIGSKKMETTEL